MTCEILIFDLNRVEFVIQSLNLPVLAITLAIILLFGNTMAFAAKPWDLVITAKFEQAEIEPGQSPVIVGTIADQKGEPIYGATVEIRFADKSVSTKTDEDGNFRYEFGAQESQGTFSANIFAKIYDLKGFGKAAVKVGTDVSTFNDLYYSADFDKNYKNDTFKSLKQKQYQKFIEDQNKRKAKQTEILAKKLAHQGVQEVAKQKLDSAINETKPGSGVYSTDAQERYLSKVDPKYKDVVKFQMDRTRQIYEEAKYEMQKILDNGGSLEDAKKAYFDKLATTSDEIQDVGKQNNTENHSKIKPPEKSKINNKKVHGLKYNKFFK
ncbi:MAG: carboxypeptidase regulatory-like domain-containing protein [Thaumarchaeota archaeon]|nr:carboxypeptidase regulatory-like domain-containing protein [Nitrososphaerota archaeon]